jgi:hypothetical protein
MFPLRDVESCEGHEPRAIAFERHESGILRDRSFDSIGESMAVVLPYTYVSPYPEISVGTPGTYHNQTFSAGQSFPPGMQNPIGGSLLVKGDLYCSPNCLARFQQQAIRDSFGIQTIVDLKAIAAADQREAEGRNLRKSFDEIAKDIGRVQQINENIIKYPTDNRVFSGGVVTPFHALAHSLYGGGKSMTFPLGNIGLKLDVRNVPSVMTAIQNARPVGTTSIDVSFPYDTAKDSSSAWLTLGNITLRVVGKVEKNSSGSWTFKGEVRAFNDRYDANPSTHRSWLGEKLTALLGKFPLTPYEVVISGSLPVTVNGN